MKNLNERAVLVSLAVSMWTGRKFDRSVTEQVAQAHGCKGDAGRYNKLLVAKGDLEAVTQVVSRARVFYYKMTLPWKDEGFRILPSTSIMEVMEKLSGFQSEFSQAVVSFLRNYPLVREEARLRLNEMFKQEDYPSEVELGRKFRMDPSIQPVPDRGDFRLMTLTPEQNVAFKRDLQRRVSEAEAVAVQDVWNRLYDVVKRVKSTLTKSNPRVYDTLIGNVMELVDILPALNITDDPELEALRIEAKRELGTYTASELRSDEHTRKEAANAAGDILTKMSGYMGE